jgi:HD domain
MDDAALAALGMPVPDSAFAMQARELLTTAAPPFLVNHSVRAYAWAVELALHDHLKYDPEILYVSAILHDIGLVPEYDRGGCFELDGATAAEAFALDAGLPQDRAHAIFDVINLHMAEELPHDPASEVVLLWDSTGTDVTGHRYADVRRAVVPQVLGAYPRLEFKREFAALFADQAVRKPICRVAEMVAAGKLEAINRAPYDS